MKCERIRFAIFLSRLSVRCARAFEPGANFIIIGVRIFVVNLCCCDSTFGKAARTEKQVNCLNVIIVLGSGRKRRRWSGHGERERNNYITSSTGCE